MALGYRYATAFPHVYSPSRVAFWPFHGTASGDPALVNTVGIGKTGGGSFQNAMGRYYEEFSGSNRLRRMRNLGNWALIDQIQPMYFGGQVNNQAANSELAVNPVPGPIQIGNYRWDAYIMLTEYRSGTTALTGSPLVQHRALSGGSWAACNNIHTSPPMSSGANAHQYRISLWQQKDAGGTSRRFRWSGTNALSYNAMAVFAYPGNHTVAGGDWVNNIEVQDGNAGGLANVTVPIGRGYRILELHNMFAASGAASVLLQTTPGTTKNTEITGAANTAARNGFWWRAWDDWSLRTNESWALSTFTTGTPGFGRGSYWLALPTAFTGAQLQSLAVINP